MGIIEAWLSSTKREAGSSRTEAKTSWFAQKVPVYLLSKCTCWGSPSLSQGPSAGDKSSGSPSRTSGKIRRSQGMDRSVCECSGGSRGHTGLSLSLPSVCAQKTDNKGRKNWVILEMNFPPHQAF